MIRKKYICLLLCSIFVISTFSLALANESYNEQYSNRSRYRWGTNHITLPLALDPEWKIYFSDADFDGDGISYINDLYLGRDDNEVNYMEKSGENIIVPRGTSIEWDPAVATDNYSAQYHAMMYDTLTQLVPGTNELMPCVAVAWDASSDFSEFTFYLRDDVVFSDGTALDANDVIYSFNRLSTEGSSLNRFFHKHVDYYEAIDQHTITFYLNDSFSTLPHMLAATRFSIIPCDTGNDDLIGNPIGSGPWIANWDDAYNSLVMTANEYYWAGRPYLDSITYVFGVDDGLIIDGWENDDYDVVQLTKNLKGWAYEEQEGYLTTTPSLLTYFMPFDCDAWPFDSVEIRQAVSLAIDQSLLITERNIGFGIPAHTLISPGSQGFSQELYDSYYFGSDLAAAVEILDAANYVDTDDDGFRERDGEKIEFTYIASHEMDDYTVACTWSEALLSIGIQMNVVAVDFMEMLNKYDFSDFQLLFLGWICDYPHSENFYTLLTTDYLDSFNRCQYTNDVVDSLYASLLSTYDAEEISDCICGMESILQEECPMIYCYHLLHAYLVDDDIHNYIIGYNWSSSEKLLDCWKE